MRLRCCSELPTRTRETMTNQTIEPDVKSAIEAFVHSIRAKYEVEHVVLFGSRARGTHRPDSDIDVAVILKGEQLPFLETRQAMSALAQDVQRDTGLSISPLPIWHEEWSGAAHASDLSLLDRIRQ